MNRRSVLAGFAIVAAVAVAVPAIAQDIQGPQFLDSRAKKIEEELRKTAHKALKKANKALKRTKQAGPTGPTGGTGPAGAAGNSPSATAFAEAPGTETTASEDTYVQLPGGPQVTVTVPQGANAPAGTGSILVAASAFVGDEAGAVSLFEDGVLKADQSDVCEIVLNGTPGPPLFVSIDSFPGGGATFGTPAQLDLVAGGCANLGPPGPVTFTTTPGAHTYELRYAYCGCGTPPAEFSERRLWVTPLG